MTHAGSKFDEDLERSVEIKRDRWDRSLAQSVYEADMALVRAWVPRALCARRDRLRRRDREACVRTDERRRARLVAHEDPCDRITTEPQQGERRRRRHVDRRGGATVDRVGEPAAVRRGVTADREREIRRGRETRRCEWPRNDLVRDAAGRRHLLEEHDDARLAGVVLHLELHEVVFVDTPPQRLVVVSAVDLRERTGEMTADRERAGR